MTSPCQRPGTVSWVLRGKVGAHHSLSPEIKLGLGHSRKKERKKVSTTQTYNTFPIRVQGPLRECRRTWCLQATLLLHTIRTHLQLLGRVSGVDTAVAHPNNLRYEPKKIMHWNQTTVGSKFQQEISIAGRLFASESIWEPAGYPITTDHA